MGKRSKIGELRLMHSIQGNDGNWNYDPYMHGMFNAFELALAIMENREPEYRKAPKRWLADIPMPENATPTPVKKEKEE